MTAIIVALLLILNVPSFASPPSEDWTPFVLPVRSLQDSFLNCEVGTEAIDAINIMDSSGAVFDIDVNQVLETEVLSVVDLSEIEIWYQVFPSDTVLTGIGLIVYNEDLVTNRDSFMIFLTDTQDEQTWWFALFRENIFTAPQGELDTWILQEENFCGLYEITLPEESEDA